MYLKTKAGAIYIILGKKGLKWKCISPFKENPDDLLEDNRKVVLIDSKDIGILHKDFKTVQKFLYVRKAFSYKWYSCINNKHEFYGTSFHKSKTEAILFKYKQKRSNRSFYTDTASPTIELVSEELLDKLKQKGSVLIVTRTRIRSSTLQ